MTENKLEKLGFSPDGWNSFVAEIAATFGNGNLISHDWLKERFGLKKLRIEDYGTVEEFLNARDDQQWAYMTCTDALRWSLLEQEKMYIRNIRGDGYEIIKPQDQVKYGYDEFVKDIKKAVNEAGLIMSNVRPVDFAQQASDNNLRAKFGLMKQMLKDLK